MEIVFMAQTKKPFHEKYKKPFLVVLMIGVASALAYGLALGHKNRLFERLWFNIQAAIHAGEWEQHSLGLSDYRAVIEAKAVSGAEGLSSLTYNHDTGTLFTVSNSDDYIIELNLEGEIIRRIGLSGFFDPEALEYIGHNQYLIVEETPQKLSLIVIGADTVSISADQVETSLTIGMEPDNNKSFEGLAYDREHEVVYMAKERDPIGLYVIKGLVGREGTRPLALSISSDPASENRIFLKDLSALAYDGKRKHLLVLSHESKLLLELDSSGEPVSSMSLLKNHSGLEADFVQAEGVALGPDDALYLMGEPNLFYVFKKATK
ncbi:DNA-binding protein [Deltaproteobacteria bacterium Smac51]|nr:DNA-binding protein [Deltaproteobacteria bacterium Smac51]